MTRIRRVVVTSTSWEYEPLQSPVCNRAENDPYAAGQLMATSRRQGMQLVGQSAHLDDPAIPHTYNVHSIMYRSCELLVGISASLQVCKSASLCIVLGIINIRSESDVIQRLHLNPQPCRLIPEPGLSESRARSSILLILLSGVREV